MKTRFPIAPAGAFLIVAAIASILAPFLIYAGLYFAAGASAIVAIAAGRRVYLYRRRPAPGDWRRLAIGDVERLAREGGTAAEIQAAADAIARAGYGDQAVKDFRELAAKALFARAPGAVRPAREITPACPDCGSKSENWRPEKDYCADCGRGVRVGASRDSLVQMYAAGQLNAEQLTALAFASGLGPRDVVSIMDEAEAIAAASGQPLNDGGE